MPKGVELPSGLIIGFLLIIIVFLMNDRKNSCKTEGMENLESIDDNDCPTCPTCPIGTTSTTVPTYWPYWY